MPRTTLLSAAVTLTVSLALALSAPPALAANPPGAHVCGTITGAHWQLAGKSGSQYAVLAYPAALCTLAKHAVARLTHAKTRFGQKLPGSPSGYTCHALRMPPKTGTPNGTCVNLHGGSTGFIWGPGRS